MRCFLGRLFQFQKKTKDELEPIERIRLSVTDYTQKMKVTKTIDFDESGITTGSIGTTVLVEHHISA